MSSVKSEEEAFCLIKIGSVRLGPVTVLLDAQVVRGTAAASEFACYDTEVAALSLWHIFRERLRVVRLYYPWRAP